MAITVTQKGWKSSHLCFFPVKKTSVIILTNNCFLNITILLSSQKLLDFKQPTLIDEANIPNKVINMIVVSINKISACIRHPGSPLLVCLWLHCSTSPSLQTVGDSIGDEVPTCRWCECWLLWRTGTTVHRGSHTAGSRHIELMKCVQLTLTTT